jgi:hypothetical protein
MRQVVLYSAVQKRSKTPATSSLPTPEVAFVKGQLWQLPDERFLKIGHVGRLLVHHRTVVPALKRSISRETLSSVKELEQFLTANKAVLVEN